MVLPKDNNDKQNKVESFFIGDAEYPAMASECESECWGKTIEEKIHRKNNKKRRKAWKREHSKSDEENPTDERCGITPRECLTCGEHFTSGNQLHRHIRDFHSGAEDSAGAVNFSLDMLDRIRKGVKDELAEKEAYRQTAKFLKTPNTPNAPKIKADGRQAKAKKKKKSTVDSSVDPNDLYNGKLKPIASRILMKLLYCARMCRLDLLRPICALAALVTKWTEECDERLPKLMSYVHSTSDKELMGYVGDELSGVMPHLFADADLGGCGTTSRSTSGLFMAVMGPNTFFPTAGQSRKQGCVSTSNPESELVALFHAVRNYGLPTVDLLQMLLGRPVQLTIHEDNTACITACKTGRNPTTRHLGRVHRISIAWLHERYDDPYIRFKYTISEAMAADIFTKACKDARTWNKLLKLIGIVSPSRMREFLDSDPLK